MFGIEHEEVVEIPSHFARGLHSGGDLEAMFCRERQLGPREAADLDASRRVKLAGEARSSLAFALQVLLQQFFLGVGLGERLDKHRGEQEGDGGPWNRSVKQKPRHPVCSEAGCIQRDQK